jgi:hypothetical protein
MLSWVMDEFFERGFACTYEHCIGAFSVKYRLPVGIFTEKAGALLTRMS